MCLSVFIHVVICTTHMLNACEGKRGASDPLELKSQTVVSQHVGAWNSDRVLNKSSKCF